MKTDNIKYPAILCLIFLTIFTFSFQSRANEDHDTDENKTRISKSAAIAAGIKTSIAGAATIKKTLTLFGHVAVEPQATYKISARYPGIVIKVNVMEGAQVQAGEVLAVIENNNTLQKYSITAPAAGVVLARNVNIGDSTGSEPLLIVADNSKLMIELLVFPGALQQIKIGQAVIAEDTQQQTAPATIEHVAPSSENNTTHIHAALGRIPELWRPGLAVNAHVVVTEQAVPLAVRVEATQEMNDKTVVFVQTEDSYEAHEITTGKRDNQWIEVTEGLEPGAKYVTENSYLLKADIEKSAASHEH